MRVCIPSNCSKLQGKFLHRLSPSRRGGLLLRRGQPVAHRLAGVLQRGPQPGQCVDSLAHTGVEMSVKQATEAGLKIVAEGVETVEMPSFLANLGIDEAQGYLMAKPLPPTEFRDLPRAGPTGLSLKRTA